MSKIEEYLTIIKEMESYSQIPSIKNKSNNEHNLKKYINKIYKSKKVDLNNFCKKSGICSKHLIISAFIYVLNRYSGRDKVSFLLNNDDTLIPIYKEINEESIALFIRNNSSLIDMITRKTNLKRIKSASKTDTNGAIILNIVDEKEQLKSVINNELLVFNIYNKKDSIEIAVSYNKKSYSYTIVNNIIESYFLIIESLITKTNLLEIQYLTKKDLEYYKIVNNTEYEINTSTINKLFEEQVIKNKDKIAVIDCDNKLTYDELNRMANKVANVLIKNGIDNEDIVTICLNRTVYSPCVRQGIIKSGGAFLNILPDYPEDRIKYIISDSNSKYFITSKNLYNSIIDKLKGLNITILCIEDILQTKNDNNPNIPINEDNLCYSIYTSGSTGKPKGVMVEHRNLINYTHVNKYNKEATVITNNINASLALASLTFDVSILEEFIPLLNGGTMVIANEEEIYNPTKLADLIISNKVEAITCTPSFINNIIDIEEIKKAFKNIKVFNIGAEAFPSSLYNRIKDIKSNARVFNGYGPTEATIGCTFKELQSDKNITIGLPMANIKIYMLDKKGSILPVGVIGELTICGNDVSRGYINRNDLNKEKFITVNGLRAYRSGDLAYWNFNKEISFIGRIDNQVKINGLRIELSEIENVITSYKNVNSCVARVIEDDKDKYICAYITAESKIKENDLRNFIAKNLTKYMLPKRIVQLSEIPLTANGKIDLKKLPLPDENKEIEIVKPKTKFQAKLVEIMRKVLNTNNIGIKDNFFESGGNSLLVMKLVTYASKDGISIGYKDVFDYPTVEELEKYLLSGKEDDSKLSDYNIKSFDYEKINKLLQNNVLDNISDIDGQKFSNVVISGATGFLGMHILHEFIENYKGKAYCFIRKGKSESLLERVNKLYKYYFNKNIKNYVDKRIILVEGDINNLSSFEALKKYDIDTFINCAALVKYFDGNNLIEKVNVEGVKNIIDYCKESNVKLIQISTTSIGGTRCVDSNIKPFKENELYFGQGLENKYSKTKFLAERLIITEMERGLHAKIMRIGNLMPRYTDSKFQINLFDNGFLGIFRALQFLGVAPASLMEEAIELSPVDGIARAVLLLSSTNEKYNVFHPFNNNSIHYYDIIHAMKANGYDIKIVSDEIFNKVLKEKIDTSVDAELLVSLFADLTASSNKKVVETEANNAFTTEVLYNLGFNWREITSRYLLKVIKKLEKDNYFE